MPRNTSDEQLIPPCPPDALFFEVSWEAGNQVGGIYQVLRSKANAMMERWGDRYLMVGPYVSQAANVEFDPKPMPAGLEEVCKELAADGLQVEHGRWLIPGRPKLLLLHQDAERERIAGVQRILSRHYGVEASDDPLVLKVLAFGETVFRLLSTMARHAAAPDARRKGIGPDLLAHFHEWLGGVALLLLKSANLPIASAFTTHATSVGRYLASSEVELYARLETLDGDAEARRFGISTQHQIESRCAQVGDVLTTVSPITAEECRGFLGRKPDLVTPNGLDIDRFDVGHDFQAQHAEYKEQIQRFVMGHFFPSYSFDLDRTLYFFNAGRFEPRNKGFDLSLESMARLNTELRRSNTDVTVIFFIVTDRGAQSLDPRALHMRGVLDDLDEVSHRIGRQAADRLFRHSAAGNSVELDDLVDEYWRLRLRRVQHAFQADHPPLLTTHILEDAEHDPVLNHLRFLGLGNAPEDRVKVVYHPEFISSVNPLWGMDYDQFVRGCHLGIFPSTYEPWGYTPLECVAMGVPAITSDLAGFGRYVGDVFPDHDEWGLVVLPRRNRSFHEAAEDLTRRLLDFCLLDRHGRIALRNNVEAHARAFDWSRLGSFYHAAHDLALARRAGGGRRDADDRPHR